MKYIIWYGPQYLGRFQLFEDEDGNGCPDAFYVEIDDE